MDEKLLVIRLSVNLKSNSLRLCELMRAFSNSYMCVCDVAFLFDSVGFALVFAAFSTDELFDFSEILRK